MALTQNVTAGKPAVGGAIKSGSDWYGITNRQQQH